MARADVHEEELYRSESTRVRRIWLPAGAGPVICKEPLGPGCAVRLGHEQGMLNRLKGVTGVVRLASHTRAGALVLDDVGGRPLSQVLRDRSYPAAEAVELAVRLARAVAAVHARGVIHKDICPDNILVSESPGTAARPVLIDFDLAGTFAEDRTGRADGAELTPSLAYMPPERTGRTGLVVDQRADLYGLGAVIYELFAGEPPFRHADPVQMLRAVLVRTPEPLSRVADAVPPALDGIVMRLLEKDPGHRYQSADGVVRDLELVRAAPERHFTVGRWDFPPRLSAPSRPVGRDAELATLRAAFDGAVAGSTSGVFVAGAPGVGKSTLIDQLRPVGNAAGAWFVTGKCDQFRPDAAAGAVTQALRTTARIMLARPDAELATLRADLAAALASGAAVLVDAVPELALLLPGLDNPAGPGDGLPPDERAARLRQAVLDMLAAVVTPEHPMVLVLDDLQWADTVTLDLLDSLLTAREVRGLLLVGAYRAREVDAAHPLTPLLARWERDGHVDALIRLANLSTEALSGLLEQVLRLAPPTARDLADALAARTAGNPFDTLELLNALRRDAVLVLGDEGWRWNAGAIRRHLDQDDVIDLLVERIARLPGPTREMLDAAVALGGDVSVPGLAVATGLDAPAVLLRLTPALEDGLMILDTSAGRDRERVRFRHDRVQEAARAATGAGTRPGFRLELARRLAAAPGYEIEAAEQYSGTDAPVTDPAERRRVGQLYQVAGRQAARSGNHVVAERYLRQAVTIGAGPHGVPPGPALLTSWHAVLYALGRLADADGVFGRLRAAVTDPIELAPATSLQVSSLTQRGEHQRAVALGLALLARLGRPRPDDLPGDIAARLPALVAWAATLDVAADVARPSSTDPGDVAIERLCNRLLPASFFCGDRAVVAWLVLESWQMWVGNGPSGSLAANLGCAGLITMAALGDYRTGYIVGRHVLSVAEARGFHTDTPVLRHRYALHLLPWAEPLENTIVHAETAREGLLRSGDLQMACNTGNELLPAVLDTGGNVAALAEEIAATLALADRTGTDHVTDLATGYRQLLRALRGETAAVGGLDDAEFSEAAFLGAHAANAPVISIYHVCRAVAAAVFGDHDALERHAGAAARSVQFVPGYPIALIHLLHGLAMATRLRRDPHDAAAAAELDRCRDWMGARAQDAPANFAHLHWLLSAERAWAAGDRAAAMNAYDLALEAVSAVQRRWQHGVIGERAAAFYEATAMRRLARLALMDARSAYASWGADAKVAQLDAAHAFPRGGNARNSADDVVDMLAILDASRLMSRVTRLPDLHAAVVEQLTGLTGATDALVVTYNAQDGSWSVPFCEDGLEPMGVEAAGGQGRLPVTAFRYAERTGETLLIHDAVGDGRFAQDPFVAGLPHCSILAAPLSQGTTRAVLVLAHRGSAGWFTGARLDTVRLLAGQLVVSIGNALAYEALEQRVAARTEALAQANRRLEILSTTDPLTGLFNRRRFATALEQEWRRATRSKCPLAVVLIDVDHFKGYNDALGHPRGDECLRQVASVLGGDVRSADVVCRYGGEEFAAILPETDTHGAMSYAERVRLGIVARRIEHPATPTGLVTVSLGVASAVPSSDTDYNTLVERADHALYDAKHNGRNRTCAADPA
ncbi:diguanylate cyclase [Dactylosporangium sp. NPDC051541]|uniref:diguanylate cyclase n=1 Tax=Dactylosporangium sp. NPDC051541 TaxID=3363977 RepID=UPI00379ACA55